MPLVRVEVTGRTPPTAMPVEQGTGVRPRIVDAEDAGPLVLLVDDAEDNRALYAEYFEESNLRVEHAVDGEHALLKIMRRLPDVIVMDLAMPVLDGWEAIRHLKANAKTRAVPVIAITGHATEENLRRARDMGADSVLTKPCSPEVLHATVRDVLDRAASNSQ